MKNIRYMTAISIVTSIDFFSSIEVAYFLGKSLSLSQLYMIYSIFSVLIFLLEVPSGYIADKLGYKITMLLGYFFGILGSLGFIFGNGFKIIVLSYFFMALMTSLISGTEDALIYESLVECKKETQFEEIYSKIKAYGYSASIIGCLIAGGLAEKNIILNPICNLIIIIVALLIMIFVKTPNIDKENISVEHKEHSVLKECKGLWGILLIAGAFMASTLIGSKFSQPLLLAGGVSLVYFGVFSTICSAINSVSSYFTTKFEKIPFEIVVLIPSIILLIIGISQKGILVVLFFVTAACRGIGNIKITARLNEKISIKSNYRATINSMKSFLFRVIYAIVIFCMGVISDYNIYFALVVGSLSIMLFMIILMYKLGKDTSTNNEKTN